MPLLLLSISGAQTCVPTGRIDSALSISEPDPAGSPDPAPKVRVAGTIQTPRGRQGGSSVPVKPHMRSGYGPAPNQLHSSGDRGRKGAWPSLNPARGERGGKERVWPWSNPDAEERGTARLWPTTWGLRIWQRGRKCIVEKQCPISWPEGESCGPGSKATQAEIAHGLDVEHLCLRWMKSRTITLAKTKLEIKSNYKNYTCTNECASNTAW